MIELILADQGSPDYVYSMPYFKYFISNQVFLPLESSYYL